MKRILLFLLLFCFIVSGVFAQPVPEVPPPIQPQDVQLESLVDFGGIFDILLDLFVGFLVNYYGLLFGIFVAYLIYGYIRGVFEGRKERLRRERVERKRQIVVEEKRLGREREYIRHFAHVDEETALRIQKEMYRAESVGSKDDDLRLAPSDGIKGNNVARAEIFQKEDGISLFEETVTMGNSTTVVIRIDKRGRFHRGMEDDGEYGGY
jgi:hypothetical protein